MASSRKTFGSLELLDSMTTVEFDAERELFRATYDSNRDSTSLVVVAVVATIEDSDPLQLAPLHSVVDTDSLEELFPESADRVQNCESISFYYEGFEVTVFAEGTIEVAPSGGA